MISTNRDSENIISDAIVDYLLSQSRESSYFDYKATLDIGRKSTDFPKLIKDVYAFANAGGGFLVLGVSENGNLSSNQGRFHKTGLPAGFSLDQASLQEKINAYIDVPLEISYGEFERIFDGEKKLFALVYIPPSPMILTSKRDVDYKLGTKTKKALRMKTVYTRRGTQSIEASEYEINQIKHRIKDEAYKISIITGEPDHVDEYLFSNLFEVKNIPMFVYVGIARYSYSSFKNRKQSGLNRTFDIQFRYYKKNVVTLDDLSTMANKEELVLPNTIHKEPMASWLGSPDKERIVISLLNNAILNKGRAQDMFVDWKARMLYYKTNVPPRFVSWRTRAGGIRKRRVVDKIYASQLGRKVFAHAAANIAIIKVYGKFFMRLNATMCITQDGVHMYSDHNTGPIITKKTYRIYNKQHLNNTLFWINQLGNGDDIEVCQDFIISSEPVRTKTCIGILSDVPASDVREAINEYEIELNEDANGEEFGF